MRTIRAVWAVFAFECRRAVSWSRGLVMLGLASFPAAILWLVRHQGGLPDRPEAWSVVLFALIPEVVCLLGLLLWVTPLVQTEVEGKTWPYLVVRPAGKLPVLLGKYAAGVVWSMLTGWLALTLALRVLAPLEQELHAWKVIGTLVALSCVAYGALFALLGVVFLRRGMIFAVAYTLLEFAVRWIPAMVKQLTVQYHLQGLLVRWMHWGDGNPEMEAVFGNAAPWQHVLVLLGYAVFLLAVAAAILRRRELAAATDAAP
jgi:ABC-type transport system involved in multi-copper enzyme maturation permease subunit